MKIKGTRKLINIGVPQGAVLSPTLFNIYLIDLLTQLQSQEITVLAFTDNVAFIAKGERKLLKGL